MLKSFNAKLLSLICFVLAMGIGTSCKKENDVNAGQIQLLSFGPTGAMHGDTIRFIGNNMNLVTEVIFTGAGASVVQSKFIQQTPEVILVTVPEQAEQGFVTLKTSQGDILSKSRFNLEVVPAVASITGEVRPGTNVTLTGKYLNWVTRVTFFNNKAVDTFVSKSLTQLVVKVPMDAQTGPLVLSYAGTKPMTMETKDTLKVTLPQATSLSPNPVKHQNDLTITGTNLDLVKQIRFTGVTTPVTTFVSQSATQIIVKVPGATRKGKISLVAASGVAALSSQDLDVVLPSAMSLSPNPVDPETNLTITGTNLDLVTGISFTGAISSVTTFVSQTPTQIVVKVPKGTLKGKLTFAVLNSTLTVETPELTVTGGLPPLADFPFAIYTDALQNTFQDWSYTNTHDFNSTANVRQGTKSVKAIYASGGYQGVTFHAGTAASTTAYAKLEFSIFGEAGTGGKKLNVVINGNYGSPAQVTVLEGEWSTFSLSLSSIGASTSLNEIVLQSAGWGGTLHIDHVGLR